MGEHVNSIMLKAKKRPWKWQHRRNDQWTVSKIRKKRKQKQ